MEDKKFETNMQLKLVIKCDKFEICDKDKAFCSVEPKRRHFVFYAC